MNNLEHFFKSAMPNCGFSRMLKAMEEILSNVVIGEFLQVEAISPEELRAYLQYITNPIDMVWLRASGIKKGPIFPKIRLAGGVGTIKEVVVPFRMKSFQFEQKTMDQWVTEKDALVHMSYDVFCDHK